MLNPVISLRALEPTDIELLYKWENDRSIWHLSNTLTPFSRHTLSKYIESSHQDIFELKQLRLMIDLTEENKTITIGAIDLFDFEPFDHRAGVGILIDDKYRNKGYASQALKELEYYCFNILDLHQLYCNINESNEKSIALFKKHGFIQAGIKLDWNKCGTKYENELIMQLIRK